MKPIKSLFIYIPIYIFCMAVNSSCSDSLPAEFTLSDGQVSITPDYRDLVIPSNIAPLNFRIDGEADSYITRISGGNGQEILCNGKKVIIREKEWRNLLLSNKGGKIKIEVFSKTGNGWILHPPFENRVANEPVDEYISYRIIPPSYAGYRILTINERNLSNFDERIIYSNKAIAEDGKAQCINCHSYQNYKTDNMQFHARHSFGGTVIVNDGSPRKVNIKSGNLISAGVYPAWHPTEKLIAYSVNNTSQFFMAKDIQKIEVIDTESDLVLYDIEKNEVSVILNDSNSMETFPAWSPDGKTLYYASAEYKYENRDDKQSEIVFNHQKLKYDIIRIGFDSEARTFGVPDTVFKASEREKSATLPRVSPDGKYLLFTVGEFGNFHIWHSSSDLKLLNLETGETDDLTELNSDHVESYHAWSSNGRWILFSSRRDDGSYTRPYLSYFSQEGKASKPFIVPQKDPDFYANFFHSYNVPEFMIEPVKLSPADFARALKKEAIQAMLKGEYHADNEGPEQENIY